MDDEEERVEPNVPRRDTGRSVRVGIATLALLVGIAGIFALITVLRYTT